MERVLRHLTGQGVESYVIDNDSTDRTGAIARSFLGRGVIGMETFPRRGVFEWAPLLKRKEELHRELGADWYLHEDADQFRYAPNPFPTLRDGILAADRAGYNAVEFDVFDFLPTDETESYDHPRFIEEMRYYYYFKPQPLFQVKAWKNFGQTIDLVTSGGHCVAFEGRRIFPEPFVQRHYIALSREHAVEKYCRKKFSEEEVKVRGWHHPRPSLRPEDFRFPERSRLKLVTGDNTWDTSEPWTRRPLFGDG